MVKRNLIYVLLALMMLAMAAPVHALSPTTYLSASDASFIGENTGDESGLSVAPAGDVNGDGYDDILIGAPLNDEGGDRAGQAYLILGKLYNWYRNTKLSAADASFIGENAGDEVGWSVALAGDVNGDGLDDILIGTRFASKTYLILGKSGGWNMDTDLSTADASFIGGGCCASAEDVNGDGYDDILISNSGYDNDTGKTYLILGKTSGWAMDTDLSAADASFIGESSRNGSGSSIASAGDVNGDSFDDILIGAQAYPGGPGVHPGKTYLILGKTSGWAIDTSLSMADASFNGEVINGFMEGFSGSSVASAGDVNGDGYDDIIIGAPGISKTYLILGKPDGWTDANLSTADASFGGGRSVASAGDVNGDGYDDILIGSTLLLGKPSGWTTDVGFIRESGLDELSCVSSAGDINGDGGADILIGFKNNDDGGTDAGKTYLVLSDYTALPTTVEVESASVPVGGHSSVDIRVRGYPAVPDEAQYGLGRYAIRVYFDPAMIDVVSILPGDAPFDSPVFSIFDDYVQISQSSAEIPGPSGDIRVCGLEFDCLAEGVSALDLAIEYLENTNGETVASTAVDGTIIQGYPVYIEVESASVPVGSSSSVDIRVKDYPSVPGTFPYGLGAYDIRIDFDPAVIDVTGVSPGDSPFDSPIYNIYDGYVQINQFHSQWPGPSGDIRLCSLEFSCLGPGVTALPLTVQTLADVDGGHVVHSVVIGTITQSSFEVEAAIAEEQDGNGVVIVPVTLVRVKDTLTDETATGIEIAGYISNLTFSPTFMEILSIRNGEPPFDTIPLENIAIDNIAGTASVSDDVSPSGIEPPVVIFNIVARLTGSALVSGNLSVNVTGVVDSDGVVMNVQDQPIVLTFQRGDVQSPVDGDVDITDALFGAQYLVGIRPLDDIRQLNMASVRHDGTGDKKDIIDCMFIAQYVVGVRDEYFGRAP